MKVLVLCLCIISHLTYATDSGEASWTKAVSRYVSDLSWRRFLLNLINPSLNDMVDEANRRTLQPTEIALDSEANWKLALLKTLSRQDTFNNIISEMLKAVTRIIGWSALMLGLYSF